MISNKKKVYILSASVFIFLILCCLFFFVFIEKAFMSQDMVQPEEDNIDTKHLVIIGRYENEAFLKKIYQGAVVQKKDFNFELDFYVPKSQAEGVSLQSLFDYASFVNADCLIAYIDSTTNEISVPRRLDDTIIPMVTTGQYDPNLQQISFIGNSNWELGKKFSDETVSFLNDKGQAFIIGKEVFSASSLSSLVNSIQDSLMTHENISYSISDSISPNQLTDNLINESVLFICLTEEDTIALAQMIIEMKLTDIKRFGIIGFGNNETCQLYLSKGIIDELISLDPEKIGETAVREFFEYRNKGYANSYIAADVKISRTMNRSNR